jgi:hypothetical protein
MLIDNSIQLVESKVVYAESCQHGGPGLMSRVLSPVLQSAGEASRRSRSGRLPGSSGGITARRRKVKEQNIALLDE